MVNTIQTKILSNLVTLLFDQYWETRVKIPYVSERVLKIIRMGIGFYEHHRTVIVAATYKSNRRFQQAGNDISEQAAANLSSVNQMPTYILGSHFLNEKST